MKNEVSSAQTTMFLSWSHTDWSSKNAEFLMTEVLLYVRVHWHQTSKLIILILLLIIGKAKGWWDTYDSVNESYQMGKGSASLCSYNISLNPVCMQSELIPILNRIVICLGNFCVTLDLRERQLPDPRTLIIY